MSIFWRVGVDGSLMDNPPLHSCVKTNEVAQRTNKWWLMMQPRDHPTNFMHLRQCKHYRRYECSVQGLCSFQAQLYMHNLKILNFYVLVFYLKQFFPTSVPRKIRASQNIIKRVAKNRGEIHENVDTLQKYLMFLEISLEVLAGNRHYWSNFRALPTASSSCFRFHGYGFLWMWQVIVLVPLWKKVRRHWSGEYSSKECIVE